MVDLMRPTPPAAVPLTRRARFAISAGLSRGPGMSATMIDRLTAAFAGKPDASPEPTLLGSIDIEPSLGTLTCEFLLSPDGEVEGAFVRLYAWSDGVVTWTPHRPRPAH